MKLKWYTLDKQIFGFLVNESYKLFIKLKGYQNLPQENIERLKDKLRNLYSSSITENDQIYIAYLENEIVGCAYVTEEGDLRDVYVKEEYQRQGIGSLLLDKVLSNEKTKNNITLNTHPEVVSFYEKNGFTVIQKDEKSIKMGR